MQMPGDAGSSLVKVLNSKNSFECLLFVFTMRTIRNKKTLLQSMTQPGMPIEWPHAAMPRCMV